MRVVFLDRDGVINIDSPDYIKSWSEFAFLPGSLEAIRRLTSNGFAPIVITNQSAVHRGLMSETELRNIHEKMKEAVRDSGGWIADIFYCPHLPDAGCDCRKPLPGLLFQARSVYGIDLAGAFMVGDSEKDLVCGRSGGCGWVVLVRTGNGMKTEQSLKNRPNGPDFVADDLAAAVDWILLQEKAA